MRAPFWACLAFVASAFASAGTTFATTSERIRTASVNAPDTASPQPKTAAPSPAAATPEASPASAPATEPSRAKDRSTTRVHLGIVSCDGAPFYSWPDRSSIPNGTAYPPARMGDAIHVIGDGTLAPNGMTLYETTIDVFLPFGVGKHFYISARCVNAG